VRELEAAAWEAHQFFSDLVLPYTILGGFAAQYWGEPRYTQYIDLTVAAPLADPERFIGKVLDRFPPRIEGALKFAMQNRVVLVAASNGVRLDITLGLPGYEEKVMARAIAVEIAEGKRVRI
jgi:hypothetical protein